MHWRWNLPPLVLPRHGGKYQDNLTWSHGKHTVLMGAACNIGRPSRRGTYSVMAAWDCDGQFSELGGEITDTQGLSGLLISLRSIPAAVP